MSDWIEWKWTEEKPYPETLETKVYVRFGDESEVTSWPAPVSFYYGHGVGSSFEPDEDHDSTITHYRLA